MAGSVGAYSFSSVTMNPRPPGERLRDVTRPGVNGHAYMLDGKDAPAARCLAIRDAKQADLPTLRAAYKALKGTVVTIVDSDGETFLNHTIVEVRGPEKQRGEQFIGSGWIAASTSTHMITVEFMVRDGTIV